MSYSPKIDPRTGGLLSASFSKSRPQAQPTRAFGLLLRGVVIASYSVEDDPLFDGGGAAPGELEPSKAGLQDLYSPNYCDVYTYSNRPGSNNRILSRVLVPNGRSSPTSAHTRLLRPAQINLATGMALSELAVGELLPPPGDLDGDHVLVGFMDDDLGCPVVLSGIPHPRALSSQGQLLRASKLAGDAEQLVHNGVRLAITENGDLDVDMRGGVPAIRTSGGELLMPEEAFYSGGSIDISMPPYGSCSVRGTRATAVFNSDGRIQANVIGCYDEEPNACSLSLLPERTALTVETQDGAEDPRTSGVTIAPTGDVSIVAGQDDYTGAEDGDAEPQPPSLTLTAAARAVLIGARADEVFLGQDARAINVGQRAETIDIGQEAQAVNLGADATEPAVLGQVLHDLLSQLTVPTPLGPSGVPINQPAFTQFLSTLVKLI